MNRAELIALMASAPETIPSGASSPQAVEAMYQALRLIIFQGYRIDGYAMRKVCEALTAALRKEQ